MKVKSESEVAQSCLTPSDPVDCSLPAASVREILQARVLEWGAIAFSGDLPGPGIKPVSPALQGGLFTTEPPGKPHRTLFLATGHHTGPATLGKFIHLFAHT